MSVFAGAAQSPLEQRDFIEAFAKVRLLEIIAGLHPNTNIARAESATYAMRPDWDDLEKLRESGIDPADVDQGCRSGSKFLHIDVAAASVIARRAFLEITGLSDKQRRDIFPELSSSTIMSARPLTEEVGRLNRLIGWLRRNGADQKLFPTYHRAVALHGRTQNRSGQVGAMGAAVAFVDAINAADATAIVDMVGEPPPRVGGSPPDPEAVFRWMRANPLCTVKSILLANGRAIVFSSSKDATIFVKLGAPYSSAQAALAAYGTVKNESVSSPSDDS